MVGVDVENMQRGVKLTHICVLDVMLMIMLMSMLFYSIEIVEVDVENLQGW